MDLNVEIKDTKIIVSWQKINADYYRVFCKKDDIFYECAKIYDNNSIRFSLVPFGENECFVQAVKDGIVIDESRKHKFKFDDIDVIYKREKGNSIKFFYSRHPKAQGYRVYKNEPEIGFNGFKNSDTTFIIAENSYDDEFKIKKIKMEKENFYVLLVL